MKVTVDTNILVRAAVQDDAVQARQAAKILEKATLVAVPMPVLCELAWVLMRGYKRSAADVAAAITHLMSSENVALNRAATEAGLAVLAAGGDFADGVIAYEGEWLGATEFVSFDKKAVVVLKAQGRAARLITGG